METVRDAAGDHYLLVKSSGESSLVRDPESGEERYLPNDDLEVVDGEPALVTAAAGVPASVRRVLTAVHSERGLGLLIELADSGPLPVRTVLGAYDLCESDLHGLLGEFRAAGLVRETRVHGERGYDATDLTHEAVAHLRERGERGGDDGDGDNGDAADTVDPEAVD